MTHRPNVARSGTPKALATKGSLRFGPPAPATLRGLLARIGNPDFATIGPPRRRDADAPAWHPIRQHRNGHRLLMRGDGTEAWNAPWAMRRSGLARHCTEDPALKTLH